MACLLQPECNFLHGYFRCWLPVKVVDVEVKITSMQGMHIFQRDRTTQLIKCTLWSTRLCPHPTIIKEMKTFLEVEGRMGPVSQSASSQYRPLNWTQTLMSKRTLLQRKERGQCPLKGLGLAQPPSLAEQPHTHLQLFPKLQPMSNPKQILQKIDPHPWKRPQFAKALHGLVLERCWETSLRTETGCSLPTTWTMTIKMTQVLPAQNPP